MQYFTILLNIGVALLFKYTIKTCISCEIPAGGAVCLTLGYYLKYQKDHINGTTLEQLSKMKLQNDVPVYVFTAFSDNLQIYGGNVDLNVSRY